MVYSFLTGIIGLVIIMTFWLGVQHFVRRHTEGTPPDCDMLDKVFHDCCNCSESETCHLRHNH